MQQTSGRGREKDKGITQSTIAHMASERLIVNFVVEMAFVSTRNRNTLVRSVINEREKRIMQRTIVHMGKTNTSAGRDVEVDIIASMGKKKGIARIVVVMRCAKPYIILPKKNAKYDGHCWYCFANLYPDKPAVRNYRAKENTVATFIKEKFPNVTWKCNKSAENGCDRRRPDLLLDMGSHIVIVEVDEHSHDVYDPTCEEMRLREIWGDVHHRKIVFIRCNTDEYKNEDGNNVPSPWGVNGLGVLTLRPKLKAA